MQICRVSRSFRPFPGGLERHVELLSRHQARRGDSVWVLQPVRAGELEEGVKLVHVPLGLLHRWIHAGSHQAKAGTLAFALRAAIVAGRLRRRDGFDIVHVHGDVIEALVFGAWRRIFGAPVVLTLHSNLNRRPLYRWFAWFTFRLIDGFVCVSPGIRDSLAHLGIAANRIAVISSGVDLSRFRPPSQQERAVARQSLGVYDGEILVVSVGRLNRVKGFAELLRAAAQLDGTSSLRFFIVGDGPEQQSLRRQAQNLSHVQFAGGVEHASVAGYLHAADIFVLPSVDLPGVREGTPTALLEAMACGLPVVCTDAGGIRHVVRDGEHGLVVPQRDFFRLQAALEKLVADPELRRQFGERNVVVMRERSWEEVAERVAAFYEHVRRMPGALKWKRDAN